MTSRDEIFEAEGPSLMEEGATSRLPHSTDPHAIWHVLRTKARQEKAVANDLASMHVAHFLPLFEQKRQYGHRREVVSLPLFTGYVFVHGTLDQAYEADRTRRVAQIIAVHDQAELEWELSNLHLAISHQIPLDPYPYLKKGIRAEVKSGSFRGLQGIIEDRTRHDRLILKVDMLGRALSVELDGAMLEPLE